jgi:hypothetical protein
MPKVRHARARDERVGQMEPARAYFVGRSAGFDERPGPFGGHDITAITGVSGATAVAANRLDHLLVLGGPWAVSMTCSRRASEEQGHPLLGSGPTPTAAPREAVPGITAALGYSAF